MCIICVELERDRLTIQEARRNFGEMAPSLGDHAKKVEETITKLEIEQALKEFLEDLRDLEND
tara:strand:+ start:30 stop:218 length:189 start_codon:yes stop_codon:yes gene_type:complete